MSLARAANDAWDRQDFETFDRLRDLDEAIRKTPTADLEAAFPSTRPTETPPSAA